MDMHRPNIVFCIVTVRDTRLVGNDKNEKAGIVEHLDRCFGAIEPAEPLD